MFGQLKRANNKKIEMKRHREFQIAWLGLKEGIHQFQYEVDDEVLEDLGFEHPDFEHLKAKIDLKFEKNSSFFQLHFDIDGSIDVPCDRCGDNLSIRLWDEFDLIIKLTENEEEAERQNEQEEADVVFISRGDTVIDVFNWIYEFIVLSIPIQHIHPNDAAGNPTCNPEALKLLEQMKPPVTDENPLWAGLKNLKN